MAKKTFDIKYEATAVKQLKKLDKPTRLIIKAWIEKNIIGTDNPRQHGKALVGDKSGFWRYRIGDYRLIVEIRDNECVVVAISVAHRREVYANKK